MTEKKPGYRYKLILHMKLSKGGSYFRYELLDYPGIFIEDSRDTSAESVMRFIYRGESEYKTISEAVEAWKKDNGKV